MRKLLTDYDSEEDDDYQPTKLEEAVFQTSVKKNRRSGLGQRIDVNQLWE